MIVEPSEDWEADFLTGAAEHMAAAAPDFLWNAAGAYDPAAGEVAQFMFGMPSTPDLAVAWSVIPLTAGDPVAAHRYVSLTAHVRGSRDPRTAPRLAHRIFLNLHGLERVVWGGIPVVQVAHQAGISLGWDGNNRAEYSSTFHVWTVMPSAHTTE